MAGTTTKSRETQFTGSDVRDLLVQYNRSVDDNQTIILNAGGLVISAGGSTLAKTVNTIDYFVNGVLGTKAAANMAVLAGTISTNNFGGWVFTVDLAGNLAARFMTQAATLAGVLMPVVPTTEVVIGFVRLNPTTAPFVGGTTLLDAANTNAIYRDAVGMPRLVFATGSAVTSKIGRLDGTALT
jgi:hypothetical protein